MLAVCLTFMLFFSSCSTGIEGTKTIKMSRAEKKETMATAEELLSREIVSEKLVNWRPGKRFFVTDDKISLILDSPNVGTAEALSGDTLIYDGTELRPGAGGETVCVLLFRKGNEVFNYNTGRDFESACRNLAGLDMPMMIDLDMVELADSILKGKTLWTRSRLWYDGQGQSIPGRKFVPVRIERVDRGNIYFPFNVSFTDGEGGKGWLYMGMHSDSGLGGETRTFPSLFSLTDPKENYQSITEENWKLIQNGRVRTGMTKNECKLALGNPDEVDAGHNWSSTIDIWSYKDGTFLRFEDGLLVNYRH